MARTKPPIERQSELLDVHLLDVLAEVEAMLRHSREVQRDALLIRGVPSPLTPAQRRESGAAIRARVAQMETDCKELCSVLHDLQTTAAELDELLARADEAV